MVFTLNWVFVQLPLALSPPPAHGAGGDEFTHAQLLRGYTEVALVPWGTWTVRGARNPAGGYREFLREVWGLDRPALA